MKNTRILIISIFLAASALIHLQGMNPPLKDIAAAPKNTAQNSDGAELANQNNPAIVLNQSPAVHNVQQLDKPEPNNNKQGQAVQAQSKKHDASLINKTQPQELAGKKRGKEVQNENPPKKQKVDSTNPVSTYNKKVKDYLKNLQNRQNQQENINLDTFQEQISSLKDQVEDIISRKKSIPSNTPISQTEYSHDLKNLTSIITFINKNKTTPRLSSLELMIFSNWWTTIINLIDDEERLKRANNRAANEKKLANRYFYATLALSSFVVYTAASSYFFGS